MALDRRITVRVVTPGNERNTFGEPIPGEFTDYLLWAEQRGAGSVDSLDPSIAGSLVLAVRQYSVRWFTELSVSSIDRVGVIDENGNAWRASNIVESDARRRLIYIEVTREVAD